MIDCKMCGLCCRPGVSICGDIDGFRKKTGARVVQFGGEAILVECPHATSEGCDSYNGAGARHAICRQGIVPGSVDCRELRASGLKA